MFAPMNPMTERIRQENERRLARTNAAKPWNLAAAIRKVLSFKRQQPTPRGTTQRPTRPAEGQAAKTA